MNVQESGELDADCNCIFLRYCDGASFAGFRPKPVAHPQNASQLMYFRGLKNFDASLDWAFKHGLKSATEFVLTGGSAGGLATFVHTDRAAALIAKNAPSCEYRSAPVVGYFLDHGNLDHTSENFTAQMKRIYVMQNLTIAPEGSLLADCAEAFSDTPHYCFMSPHMHRFIKSPFFMFNSKYDFWQLKSELLLKEWHTKAEQDAVLKYGEDFLEQFLSVESQQQNGAMITSCICHSCSWIRFVLGGKNSYQHYADWYYGKANGSAAIHIDTRGPNGDGTMVIPGGWGCKVFPSVLSSLVV